MLKKLTLDQNKLFHITINLLTLMESVITCCSRGALMLWGLHFLHKTVDSDVNLPL